MSTLVISWCSLFLIHFSFFTIAQSNNGNLSQDILAEITASKVFRAIVAIAVAYALTKGIQTLANFISERVPRRFRLIVKQSLPFWKGLVLITIISYLSNLFINVSEVNLFALTGTIAVALGFAFKDYLSSIVAGIVALYESPYRVGDRVRIGDHYGEVVGYGLRSIQLQTPDDNLVTIPHGKIWTDAISNANSGELEAMVVTDFYFDPNVNIEEVVSILYQAGYSSQYTQLQLPVVVIISEQWGITHFKLKAYPMDARNEFIYQTDLIRRAKQAFAQKGLIYAQIPMMSMEKGES